MTFRRVDDMPSHTEWLLGAAAAPAGAVTSSIRAARKSAVTADTNERLCGTHCEAHRRIQEAAGDRTEKRAAAGVQPVAPAARRCRAPQQRYPGREGQDPILLALQQSLGSRSLLLLLQSKSHPGDHLCRGGTQGHPLGGDDL